MQNLPKEMTTKHKLENGNPVPSEKMNKWGHPSSEHYVFVGSTTIRNTHTRVDEKTDEKRKVLIVSHISTWKPVSNEKTATQLKKEKAQRKAQRKAGIPKPKKRTKQELKDECKAMGLKVGGNMSQLQARLDNFYASLPSTDDLSIDDEGNVINPAKEESE